MVFKRRDVESALEKKGFQRTEGHHHFFTYHTKAGEKTRVNTQTSHGSKHREISHTIAKRMASQCKLKSKEFANFVECSLSQDQYERKLEELGEIQLVNKQCESSSRSRQQAGPSGDRD